MNHIVNQKIMHWSRKRLSYKRMQEMLDDNDILKYSTQNKGKSVIAERFMKTLKTKIYTTITAKESKSFLIYLNKLVDRQNNTYHHSKCKKTINANYSALNEAFESNPKSPKFKVNDRVRITKYKSIVNKSYIENWSREILIINSVLKNNIWSYKTKDLTRKKKEMFIKKIVPE